MDGVTHSDASSHFTFLEGKTFPPDFNLAMFWGGEDVTPTHSRGEVAILWILGFIKFEGRELSMGRSTIGGSFE